jgi:hypothetical protein
MKKNLEQRPLWKEFSQEWLKINIGENRRKFSFFDLNSTLSPQAL